MTRRTFVYDRDLDTMVEITEGTNIPQEPKVGEGMQIIRDIEPYKAAGADQGKIAPVIGGRRQHREFLSRNNYVEVGNESAVPQKSWVQERRERDQRIADIKLAGSKILGWL